MIFLKNKNVGKNIDVIRLPWSTAVKRIACNAGDAGDVDSIRELGRFPGGGNGNPLQYSCLENLMDRGAWRATVQGVAESRQD